MLRAPMSRGRSARRRAAGRPRRCPGRGRARSARRRRACTSTGAPGGLHLAALSSRFAIARSRLAGMPTTVVGVELGFDRHVGWFRVARRIASSVSRSSRTSSSAGCCSSPRASSVSSAIRSVISPSCATTSCEQLRALVRRKVAALHASTSMFVRRLVSGVRSSCEASWTSCRCAAARSSSDCEHRVEVAASRRARRCRATSMRCERSRVARTCSAVSLRSRTGFSAARATRKPERQRRSRCRRARRAASQSRIFDELVVDVRRAASPPRSRSRPGGAGEQRVRAAPSKSRSRRTSLAFARGDLARAPSTPGSAGRSGRMARRGRRGRRSVDELEGARRTVAGTSSRHVLLGRSCARGRGGRAADLRRLPRGFGRPGRAARSGR